MRRLIGKACTATGLVAVMIAASAVLPTNLASGQPEAGAPTDFVSLQSVDPTIRHDIRYFTAHNFTGKPVDGYRAPLCILTRAAAEGLQRAQQQLMLQGYSLKVYDCYRPQRAVNAFIAWAEDLGDQRMKTEFYPHIDKSNLFRDGYIAEHSGHSRGSTMDLTLIKLPAAPIQGYLPDQPLSECTAPVSARFPDDSIDMGTGFDCFDTLAHTADPRIQGDQLKNRLLLTDVLHAQGFVNYAYEWWHFTYQPEPYPDTYFDFPVEQSSVP